MEFKKLVDKKSVDIKKNKEHIDFLQENFVIDDFNDVEKLIKLLEKENELYERLKYDNFLNINSKIQENKQNIYHQILIIQNEIKKDFQTLKNAENKETDTIQKKYKNLPENKEKLTENEFFKDIANTYIREKNITQFKQFLNFIISNRWLLMFSSTLLGALFYIAYFLFSISYIPILPAQDIIFILVELAVISLIFIVIFGAVYYLQFVFLNDILSDGTYNKKQKNFIILSPTLFIFLFFGFLYINKSSEYIPIAFFITSIIVGLGTLYFVKKNCNNSIIYIFSSVVSCFILIVILGLFSIFFLSASPSLKIWEYVFFFVIVLLFNVLFTFIFSSLTSYEKPLGIIFIAIIAILATLFTSKSIVHVLNLGNNYYTYLTLSKKAIASLPKEIYQNKNAASPDDINTSLPFYSLASEDSIRLYNVLALSQIGKFYYIEAQMPDTNKTDVNKTKKIRFEIQSDFVQGGQKYISNSVKN